MAVDSNVGGVGGGPVPSPPGSVVPPSGGAMGGMTGTPVGGNPAGGGGSLGQGGSPSTPAGGAGDDTSTSGGGTVAGGGGGNGSNDDTSSETDTGTGTNTDATDEESSAGGDSGGGDTLGEDAFAEDNGLDCEVGTLPDNIPANQRLPNPFEKVDGSVISSKAEWRCQRKELRAKAERYIFGKKEPKPEMVSGTVTNSEVTVNVSHNGQSIMFTAAVDLPDGGSAPYPVVIAVGGPPGGFTNPATADDSTIKSEGVAIIRYNAYDLGAEGNRGSKSGKYYTIYGSNNPTGVLAAWAWGASRIIDVIEASDGSILDKQGVGVSGCSRFGKGAFAVGALDERIALSIPFESGTAGVGIYRGIGTGEGHPDSAEPAQSLQSGYGEAPWLGDAFQPFINSVNSLPTDAHEIVAMYAPRGLLILDNPHIGHLGAKWAHASALAGFEVYKALGVEENFSYLSNTGNGTHCAARSEYQALLREAIQKHLFKSASASGGSISTQKWAATAGDWIDWQTPTLQ